MKDSLSELHVCWLQLDILWHDPQKNISRIEKLCKALPATADILFLPEMFTTGFTMEPQFVAESMYGNTITWMSDYAKSHKVLTAGSVVIRENNHFVNRFIFSFPDGRIEYYDKRHLFNHAGEGDHYVAGSERKVITYKGWRILPLVCYDLRFPVWSRNNLDYDLLVYVANWPEPRIHHWDNLLLARAIENQAFTLGVNRTGVDGYEFNYVGHSGMVRYDGHWIEHANENEGVYQAVIDIEKMRAYRRTFQFLKDQDTFEIQ